MQLIYEKDLMHSIKCVALRSLARFERKNFAEFESLDLIRLSEIRAKLLRKAFEPKVCVKMGKRLQDRGHVVVPGEGPVRPTMERRRQRFGSALRDVIAEASKEKVSEAVRSA